MGQLIKDLADWFSEPTRYTLLTTGLLAAVLIFRKKLTHPYVFMGVMVGMAGFFLFAWPDKNFNKIITKPDNVPIVILIVSVLYFTWLALRRGVLNDERTKRGEPTLEGELAKKKVFTWPDLVYTELICIVLFTAALMVWSISIQAPIEEPASLARTPNPSKAPWYFLGLQELLTMFHPMVAGVTIPGVGLILMIFAPFVDKNPSNKPEDRKFATSLMTVHLMFWAVLVMIGSFFRGPGFNFTLPWRDGLFFEL